jgi:hypothetical protein
MSNKSLSGEVVRACHCCDRAVERAGLDDARIGADLRDRQRQCLPEQRVVVGDEDGRGAGASGVYRSS